MHLSAYMQLSFFLIDQKCNVFTDGRRFLIQILLKDPGPKRLKPRVFLSFTLDVCDLSTKHFVTCLDHRRMTKLLNLYQSMAQQNGH